jgi:hypothetical protein
MRIAGDGSAKIYSGVVEDRMDPLKLGRVRVRVIGVHTEDVTLIPTADLPWATIASSPTNAGISGLGWSPNGLSLGSWVFVQFIDGDSLQIPIVIGTSYGINPTSKISSETVGNTTILDGRKQLTPTEQAQQILGGKTTYKPVANTTVANTNDPIPSSDLGSVSEKYESNGNAGTISSGEGDNGGVSYGAYQLSTNSGSVQAYVRQSKYKSQFAGLAPNTPEFNSKWKSIAESDAEGFKADQKDYIERTNYTPCLTRLPSLQERGPGVQNAIWSVSVQHGPAGGSSVINKALNGHDVSNLSDSDICSLVKDYQSNNVQTLFKKSPTQWTSLQNRFSAEKKDLQKICADSPTGVKNIEPKKDSYNQDIDPGAPVASETDKSVSMKIGFVDPTGKLPKKGYLGKPDTNRLARAEELDYTLLEFKKRTRVMGNGYVEPASPYVAKYPNNKVYMSESGHVIEIDDTPKGERIHVWHKSGSYIEFQPDGTIVKKSYKDDHEIVLGEDKTYVTGNMSVFVEGNVSMRTLGNFSIEAEGNVSITAGGSMNLGSVSNMSISTNADLNESANNEIIKSAKRIRQNSSSRSSVSVDVGAKIAILREYALEDTSVWTVDEPTTPADKSTIIKETGIDPTTGEPPVQPQSTDAKEATIKDKIAISTDANPQLSEHFWLSDLTTNTAFPHALVEQCGLTRDELIANLQNVAVNILEPLVSQYGRDSFIITSGFRPVSGSGKSQHFEGKAVDVQFPSHEMVHLAQETSLVVPKFDQMILEYHGRAPVLHISYNEEKQRKMKFTTFTGSFKPILPYGFYDKQMNLVYTA